MQISDLPVETFNSILNFLESHDLLQCALVCKRWTPLAVDVKWTKRVLNFVDLMEMIGAVENVYNSSDRSSHYRFNNRPTTEEALASNGWSFLNAVRRKITYIAINQVISPEDVHYIVGLRDAAEPSSSEAFCPNLRHLILNIYTITAPFPYYLFAGKSLHRLRIKSEAESPQSIDGNLMRKFAERSPHLQRIWIRAPGYLDGFHEFGDLRELKCIGDISVRAVIRVLEHCSRLESLDLEGLQSLVESQSHHRPRGLTTSMLPHLLQLKIGYKRDRDGTGSIELLEALLMTDMPALVKLNVGPISPQSDVWRTILQSLGERAPHLARLVLLTDSDEVDWGVLGAFRKLREVSLSAKYSTFTSEAILQIADGNPGIERLHLHSNRSRRSVSPLIPQVLEGLAAKCKQLRHLSIPLDASRFTVPESANPSPETGRFDCLTGLAMNLYIPANVIPPFATYLAQLCPQVGLLDLSITHSLQGIIWHTVEEHRSRILLKDVFCQIRCDNKIDLEEAVYVIESGD